MLRLQGLCESIGGGKMGVLLAACNGGHRTLLRVISAVMLAPAMVGLRMVGPRVRFHGVYACSVTSTVLPKF